MVKGNMVLLLKNTQGKVVFEKKLTSLPLLEETILSKSVEFFNDPEPCMIHRCAVMKRIYFEISDFIEGHILKQDKYELPWDKIPEHLRQMVDVKEDISVLAVKVERPENAL